MIAPTGAVTEVSALSGGGSAEIIPIDWTADDVGKVDARTLWSALGSKKDFSSWFKVKTADFTENDDFGVFDKIVNNSVAVSDTENGDSDVPEGFPPIGGKLGGRPTKDYWFTVDAAKEVCMMEQTETGRRIRKYFIAAEKAYRKQLAQPALPTNYREAVVHLLAQIDRNIELEAKVDAQQDAIGRKNALMRRAANEITTKYAPKVKAFNLIMKKDSTEGALDIETFVNAHRLNKYIGPIQLFDHLREWGWVRKNHGARNRPTDYAQEAGYLIEINRPYQRGEIKVNHYTSAITERGGARILEKLCKTGIIQTINKGAVL
ncbi:MAG: antA/AntB antirepressor family protein [Chitinispirillales bacterium]|jgi:anti-repressor protein|nr:antA/AntB antirepressor family protein [Chitinispirillales bacterium]